LDIGLNLEIKPCPGRAEQTAGIALSMALTLWPTGRPAPLVSSFSIEALAMAQTVAPHWPRGLLMDDVPDDWVDIADRLGAATININAKRQTPDSVRAFRAGGRPVLAYTVNDADQARRLFQWGVAGVFTDTPKELYESLTGRTH
jgi:glycerophosphoryl diester phosphodiesterase